MVSTRVRHGTGLSTGDDGRRGVDRSRSSTRTLLFCREDDEPGKERLASQPCSISTGNSVTEMMGAATPTVKPPPYEKDSKRA